MRGFECVKKNNILEGLMFKRLKYLLCLSVFILVPMSVSAATSQGITVMTRNLFIGADLVPVISAQTPEEFLSAAQDALAQAAANNFPERARSLAAEIVEKKPHLVGLQEVYNFTRNGSNSQPPFRDHLKDLMNALAAQGVHYRVAAVVKEMDIQVPLGDLLLGLTDRDVILARSDVATSIVPVALSGCRASMDGCNYQVVAGITSPIGEITVERGFVAVDAMIGSSLVRFVNTHMEEREMDPGNPNPYSQIFQSAQAFELVSVLAGLPNPQGAPVVVVGDINSSQQDKTSTVGPYTIVPPYKQFVGAGYTDTWPLRPGAPAGLTCCQSTDLLNQYSSLYERVDVIFTSRPPVGRVKVNLVGNDEVDKTPSGLWPSDHAGVLTRLEIAQ